MIEVKAYTKENNKTHVDCNVDGTRINIVDETLAVISTLVGDFAKEDPAVHTLILLGLSEHPEIIYGENEIRRKGAE